MIPCSWAQHGSARRLGWLLVLSVPLLLTGCPPVIEPAAPPPGGLILRHVGASPLADPPVRVEPVGDARSASPTVTLTDIAFQGVDSPDSMLRCTIRNAADAERPVRLTITNRTAGRASGPTAWSVPAAGSLSLQQPLPIVGRGPQRLAVRLEDGGDGRVLFVRPYQVDLPPVLAWDGLPRWIGPEPVVFTLQIRPDTPVPAGQRLEVRAADARGGGADDSVLRPVFGRTGQQFELAVDAGCPAAVLAARLIDAAGEPVTPWLLRRVRRLPAPPVAPGPPAGSQAAGDVLEYGADPQPWLEALTGIPWGPEAAPASRPAPEAVRLPSFDTWRLEDGNPVLFAATPAAPVPAPQQLRRWQQTRRLDARGGRGQVVFLPFLLYARDRIDSVTLAATHLDDGRGHRITRTAMRIFQQVGNHWLGLGDGPLAAGTVAKFILQIALPSDAPAGVYRGELIVQPQGAQTRRAAVTVELDPFLLPMETGIALMVPAGQWAAGDWRIAADRLLQMTDAWSAVLPPPAQGAADAALRSGEPLRSTSFADLAAAWPEAEALTRLRRWRPREPLAVDWRRSQAEGKDLLELASGVAGTLGPAGLPPAVHIVRPADSADNPGGRPAAPAEGPADHPAVPAESPTDRPAVPAESPPTAVGGVGTNAGTSSAPAHPTDAVGGLSVSELSTLDSQLPTDAVGGLSARGDAKDGFDLAWWVRLQSRGDQKVVLAPDASAPETLAALRQADEDRFHALLLDRIDPPTRAWLTEAGRRLWWTPAAGGDPETAAEDVRWSCGFAALAAGAEAVVVPERTAAGPILAAGAGGKFVPTTGWAALLEAENDLRTALAAERRIAAAGRGAPGRLAALADAADLRAAVLAAAREHLYAGRRPTWQQMNLWRAALAAAANELAEQTAP